MDNGTIYLIVAIVVAITSTTIMRVKLLKWDHRFDFLDAFLGTFFGVVWPFTIVVWVVHLISGFLFTKFFKAREDN